MKPQGYALLFFFLWALLPFAWNVFALHRWPNDRATMSEAILDAAEARMEIVALICFVGGAVLSHWFWRTPPRPETPVPAVRTYDTHAVEIR